MHPVGVELMMLGFSGPTWPLDYGRLASGSFYTVIITVDPRQTGGELSTCKCAHEQPYCHLVVSERGLGMHLPVTSTSVSAVLLAQGEEGVGGRVGIDRSLGRDSWREKAFWLELWFGQGWGARSLLACNSRIQ